MQGVTDMASYDHAPQVGYGDRYIVHNGLNKYVFYSTLHDLTPIICAVCARAVKLLGVGQWVALLVAMTTKGKRNPAYN